MLNRLFSLLILAFYGYFLLILMLNKLFFYAVLFVYFGLNGYICSGNKD